MPIPLGILAAAGAGGAIAYKAFVAQDSSSANYRAVAVDANENVYQAGSDGSIIKSDQYGNVIWGRKLGTVVWRDCAIDSSGDIYLVGVEGGSNGVAAKYNSSGVIQWQRSITNNSMWKIHISGSNLYIAGADESAGGWWLAEFTNTFSRNYSRKLSNISLQGDICYYNSAIFASGYSFTGGSFKGVLWGTNSGGSVFQQNLVATNLGNVLGGGVATDGTFLYHAPQPEISSAYQQSIIKLNTSYAVQASRNIATGNSTFGVSFDSEDSMIYVNTSVQLFKYNTSLTTQWQRELSNLNEGSINARNTSYYIGGSGGVLYKFPQDGTETRTYTINGNNYTYSSVSLTETSPIAGVGYTTNSTSTNSSHTPTINTSTFTDSAYTPTRSITGV